MKTNMKIKKSILIFGVRYKLQIKPCGDGFMGWCDRKKKIITIDKGLSNKDFNETLLHEIGHAITHEGCLSGVLTPELDEILVETFSRVIPDLFNVSMK